LPRASPCRARRNQPQPIADSTLLAAIEEFQFDCAIGGARRDEEKARAKERFFSFRDGFGQWDPKNQRPEIWNLYNARVNPGENMRVFPLSNWTEMDVWEYIKKEKLEVPTIYFSHSANASAATANGCPSPIFAPKPKEKVQAPCASAIGESSSGRVAGELRGRPRPHRSATGQRSRDQHRHERRIACSTGKNSVDDIIAEDRRRARDRARAPAPMTRLQRSRDGRPQESRDIFTTSGNLKKVPFSEARLIFMPHTQHPIEILRFNTCGSVDDGKSTLIGRLLYDSKSLMEDQIEALERSADITGGGQINLANLTDGLRAEREQGITIDVAYRYFATPKRKFIVADTPGHVQYTRNMVTGASTANLSIVLVDARQGVIEQTRRHTFIAALLGIPHLVIAGQQNGFGGLEARNAFWKSATRSRIFCRSSDAFRDVKFIPMSALNGDNVVDASKACKWYDGPTLLEHLETVHIASDWNLSTLRFPVQWVNRPNNPTDKKLHDFRGLSGQIASGIVRKGQEVVVLPAGIKPPSRTSGLTTARSPRRSARNPSRFAWNTTLTSAAAT
jgi:sulfate adenylyltransferase large subunit